MFTAANSTPNSVPPLAGAIASFSLMALMKAASLPPAIGDLKGALVALARDGWEDDNFSIAAITSFDVSLKRKTVVLHLSADRFLAGEDPLLAFEDGKWKLYTEGPNKHVFDDIGFVLIPPAA